MYKGRNRSRIRANSIPLQYLNILPLKFAQSKSFMTLYDSVAIAQASNLVSQWSDQIGSNHSTQATDANKPTYAANVLNGYGTLTFDGSNDNLSFPSNLYNLANTNYTMFFVCKKATNETLERRIFTIGASGSTRMTLRYDAASSDPATVSFLNCAATDFTKAVVSNTFTTQAWNIITVRRTETEHYIKINDSNPVTNDLAVSGTGMTAGYIGANGNATSVFLKGSIAHFSAVGRSLSDFEINRMVKALKYQFGL